MPQQAQVIDAVRPADHPRDHAGHLHLRVHPAPAADPHMLISKVRQARALGQRHHRHQPSRDTRFGSSNVAWIFARSCNNRTCEVSSQPGTWKLSNSHRPSSEGTFRVDTPHSTAVYTVDS